MKAVLIVTHRLIVINSVEDTEVDLVELIFHKGIYYLSCIWQNLLEFSVRCVLSFRENRYWRSIKFSSFMFAYRVTRAGEGGPLWSAV